VHCTEVPNKTKTLDARGFWKPALTSHNNCSYGVDESWWKKHPKQKAAAEEKVAKSL
jgi:hypothetical protein